MYLIDSSVWINYLRGQYSSARSFFAEILESRFTFGLTEIIYQEVLQGAASLKDFELLKEFLGSQHFYTPLLAENSYEQAAKIYFNCRKKGITIRSTTDCLIAQIAIEYDLILVHDDQDYLRIASVCKKLKLYNNF